LYKLYSGISGYYIPLCTILDYSSKTVMAFWFVIYVALTLKKHNVGTLAPIWYRHTAVLNGSVQMNRAKNML
jgi:hypothetical protein